MAKYEVTTTVNWTETFEAKNEADAEQQAWTEFITNQNGLTTTIVEIEDDGYDTADNGNQGS